ncbi:MAG: D-aminoacyl-tRNA deacylase [bacterium]
MRAVVQRVSRASVAVDGKVVGEIGRGLVILLGVREGDREEDARWMAEKCAHLRIFENEEGKFHFSVLDIMGEILAVSQFTLYGDCRRGRRPSFTDAASPEVAEALYRNFVESLRRIGLKVETGVFAARMKVEIHNDGPVTLIVDSEHRR